MKQIFEEHKQQLVDEGEQSAEEGVLNIVDDGAMVDEERKAVDDLKWMEADGRILENEPMIVENRIAENEPRIVEKKIAEEEPRAGGGGVQFDSRNEDHRVSLKIFT